MKKLILIFILFPAVLIAQSIKGTVIDKTNNTPIEDANVFVKQLDTRSLTNEKGEFKLVISGKIQETDTLYISHIGYIAKKVPFTELKLNNSIISLEPEVEILNGAVVSKSKALKLKIAYTKLAPLKYAISSFGSILKDNKIYVIGGDASFESDALKKIKYTKADFSLNDYIAELRKQMTLKSYSGKLLIYDIKANSWETSKIKFRKRAYHNLNFYNNTIYVLGGKTSSANGKFEYLDNKIEVFDITKESITIDDTNPHQAADFASFTYNDNIIAVGGSIKMAEDGIKEYSNKVHSYNITSGYWYELPDMLTAKETEGVLIGNKIYLIGGFNGKPISEMESFDLTTEKWQTEGELFYGLSKPAVTYHDSTIYILENEKIFTYNILTKQLKEYLISLPLKAAEMFYSDSKLFLLGGFTENDYSRSPSSNTYSIDITEFENTKINRSKFL
ncbi:carboxypeptidase-like regulatory domain-containing protein [Flavobacterium sp. LS1R49]|uniref:Carboxypeptidase-like regulatory domain-containing protein n=1 Tax=Flavobacterium shii TaxID=2987687 RepID=A0A9X2ZDG7_9FLAO|nr:carboxypeptidase-like regulatory domain-containing protein [Flavobacterium shii]MCV9926522.1 carboxypeptidase-like regulatory domain-containing protein [Flavobacterium shii]